MDATFKLWLEAIKEVGFPIIACGWFMFRADKRLSKILELQKDIVDNCYEDKED